MALPSPATTGSIVVTASMLTSAVAWAFTLGHLTVPDTVVGLIVALLLTIMHWFYNWLVIKVPEIKDIPISIENAQLAARNVSSVARNRIVAQEIQDGVRDVAGDVTGNTITTITEVQHKLI